VPLQARVIALPKRYRIPPLALPGARKFQQGGVSLSASIGDSEEFLSLRDYRPGDPLQRLHWKSFARTGKPIVKEYQDEFFERHALVLDTGTHRGEDAAVRGRGRGRCVVRLHDRYAGMFARSAVRRRRGEDLYDRARAISFRAHARSAGGRFAFSA
jgi:hypothetical protein